MRDRTRRGFVVLRNLLPKILAVLVLSLWLTPTAQGGNEPSADGSGPHSWEEEGLFSESPLFHPGKLDFHFTQADAMIEYNLIAWTPVFKGGAGLLDIHGGENVEYAGGFLRPFAANPELGELIVGFHFVDTGLGNDYEFQGEYRLPGGLGVGGGFVRRNAGPETRFVKITYRNKWEEWNYILAGQLQEDADETDPGGYVALYNEQVMVAGGIDGEQWRTGVGYVAPPSEGLLRPAVEVLYVDNSIGALPGPRFLFINGTLKFKGGFLSHPARLGRAMGPQGLEYGNPLGFLRPTWNRRLDPWELGGLADVRYVRLDLPDGTVTEKYEGVVYPFQFDGQENCLDWIFIGGFVNRTPAEGRTGGLLAGLLGQLGFLNFNLAVEQDLETGETRAFVGLIDKI